MGKWWWNYLINKLIFFCNLLLSLTLNYSNNQTMKQLIILLFAAMIIISYKQKKFIPSAVIQSKMQYYKLTKADAG